MSLEPWNPESVSGFESGRDLLPNDDILSRKIFGLAHAHLAVDLDGIQRGRDLDHHIVRAELGRKIGLDVDGVLDERLGELSHERLDAERQVDIGRGAISIPLVSSSQSAETTYRMSSNSPSGGMNEIVRSESNLPSLTHWWNWQSSSSTEASSIEPRFDAFLSLPSESVRVPTDGRSNARLLEEEAVVETKLALRCPTQVRPHQDLAIYICSQYVACLVSVQAHEGSKIPFELMLRFTVSITSTNTSFLRYLTSVRRHEVAPVAWIVILDASSRCSHASVLPGSLETTYDCLLGLDTLCRDVHFKRVGLGVLGVAKIKDL